MNQLLSVPTKPSPQPMADPNPSASSPPEHTADGSPSGHDGRPSARGRRWLLLLGILCALTAAGLSIGVSDPFAKGTGGRRAVETGTYSTALGRVTRGDLSSQTSVSATRGYAGDYKVVNEARGTGGGPGIFTALPAVGQVIRQGHVLYDLDGRPVVLLYGRTPAYRTLSAGMAGADVAELNADLVRLGYATEGQLDPSSNYFSPQTSYALQRLQAKLGLSQTGTLALGEASFLPGAARITAVFGTLGGPADPGQVVISATSTTRQVSIALAAAQQSEVAVGDRVRITLPNNRTTRGVISSLGTVAKAPPPGSSEGEATVTVLVAPSHPKATGRWDRAPVNVTITSATVHDALAVPVDALLANAAGGYSVEVLDTDGTHRLLAVNLGIFDDAAGLVQVTGPGLREGQRIVVPST